MASIKHKGSAGGSERIHRAHHALRPAIQHMRIDHRRLHLGVSKQLLHRADILARLQQVCRKTVPETMRREPDGQPRLSYRRSHGPLQMLLVKMVAPDMT